MEEERQESKQGADAGEAMLRRQRELTAAGVEGGQAFGIAALEMRVRQWAEGKLGGEANVLEVLLYGDFAPLEAPLEVPALRIKVFPQKLENTFIRNALTVHRAHIGVDAKTVECACDAARRMNAFIGAHTAISWGNGSCAWWSFVTHGGQSSGQTLFDEADIRFAIDRLLEFPREQRRHLEDALYWIREPQRSILEGPRVQTMRTYAAYWNAFESLVELIHKRYPPARRTVAQKEAAIQQLLERHEGRLTVGFVEEAYRQVVDRGFRAKALHALIALFDKPGALHYYKQCFLIQPKEDRLYGIRNAIQHGTINAEDPMELVRVQSRLHKLWFILWGMLSPIMLKGCPRDPDLEQLPEE